MGEIDHATLEARLARVSWARLRELSIALDGCKSPEEAAERAAARGLVALDWFTGDARRYARSGKRARAQVPPTVTQVALVAAAHETMLRCEELAREAHTRSWGLNDDSVIWSVVPGRYASPEGASYVQGPFVATTWALDGLSAREFNYESYLWSDDHRGERIGPRLCSLAAASVLTTRTAWRLLRRERPSPAEPMIELYALGAAFHFHFEGLDLLLPEPEYPLIVCARCQRIEPYDPDTLAGETRRECAACGLFCRDCFDGPPEAPCPLCGAAAAHRRVGPPRG